MSALLVWLRAKANSLTFVLLFPKLFKFCIGILLGWRSRPHTRWDLCLCFSLLILDSSVSVDIACFSMKGALMNVRSSRNHDSYKVLSTSFSVAVWVYHERWAHIFYAFSMLIFQHKTFLLPPLHHDMCSSESKRCVCVSRTCLRISTIFSLVIIPIEKKLQTKLECVFNDFQ